MLKQTMNQTIKHVNQPSLLHSTNRRMGRRLLTTCSSIAFTIVACAASTGLVAEAATFHKTTASHAKTSSSRHTRIRHTTSTANQASVTSTATASMSTTATATTSNILPPGVHMDSSIQPIAGPNASWQQKFDAVLQVAQSKLGTPYIWGHNEDRGQYGFDCSNFTAYVYHHALGYVMSGASQTQYASVGTPVAKQDMRPGDLLIFEDGAHVGIYIGNNQMIEEGGGLGKVGYLSVAPGTYWGDHLTVVKRMF